MNRRLLRFRGAGFWSFIGLPLMFFISANSAAAASALTAHFAGVGADPVSETVLSPDGRADFNLKVAGLLSVPSEIQVLSDTGGIWHAPFNGENWGIAFSDFKHGAIDLYFSQYPSTNFSVKVTYANGTTEQAVATNSTGNANADFRRFLQQATFGSTPALITNLNASGSEVFVSEHGQHRRRPPRDGGDLTAIKSFLNQQVNLPMVDYPDLEFWPQIRPATCIETCQRDNYTYYQVHRHFFSNALGGQDQLRQRVAFGLSQILVTSQVDVPRPAWMRSYQQLLYRSAFGNFRQLLYDMTLHPTMGRFLDMLNSRCQRRATNNDPNICRGGLVSQPNENFGREILQLFSIGTFLLNQDGTRKLDGAGNPIPTYDQKTIEEFARVFTGWVLAPALPAPVESGAATVPNYRDPMVQHKDSQNREDYHDRGLKTLLNGQILPAGQTANHDLDAAIDNIAFHPNVAPFVSKQLIQQMVTSNPSPAYVGRISAVFTAERDSQTQLFEVVKAILLDAEARGDFKDPTTEPNYGKLREPVLLITNILRAFNATSDGILNSPGGGIGAADMGEDLFNAPSVFNYFPPTARVPGENAVGPEFAIFSSLTSLRRANFVNQVIFSTIAPAPPNRPLGTSIDLTPFDSLAAEPDQLLDTLDHLLLHGSMTAEMRETIKTAVSAIDITNPRLRARTAVYLIASSSQYQVQR